MTQAECEAFLAEPHVGVIAIQRNRRAPLCVPLWYNYSPGGEVLIWTGGEAAKVKLAKRAGRFSLCAQKETLPYKYVSVEGPVVTVEPANLEDHIRPLVERYLDQPDAESYLESLDGSDGEELGVLMRMAPERWYSEDYSKQYG